jgi:hypothetical protein
MRSYETKYSDLARLESFEGEVVIVYLEPPARTQMEASGLNEW